MEGCREEREKTFSLRTFFSEIEIHCIYFSENLLNRVFNSVLVARRAAACQEHASSPSRSGPSSRQA
jgi:hypothetical protein